jgi:hypothetical protein
MANNIWDGIVTYAQFAPAGVASVNSTSFNLPRAAGAVSFLIPALDGVGTTVKIQGLSPLDGTTWSDVFAYDPGDGTMTLVGLFPESQYTVVPASALGLGTFRLVASASQTTTVSVPILIDRII